MKFITLSLTLFFVSCQAPMWADEFQVAFNETTISGGQYSYTSGILFYDWINRQYRIDRVNGRGDRFCGTTYDKNTPCRHYVKEGRRYLHFPNLGQCCHCCDDENGCGVLKPDWAADAQYVENIIDNTGRTVEKWNKQGGQPNFIYQTVDTKINTQIDQVPNDFMYFDLDTYQSQVDDKSLFDLPESCLKAQECLGLSFCQRMLFQGQTNQQE